MNFKLKRIVPQLITLLVVILIFSIHLKVKIEEEKLFLKWSHLLFQNRRKTLLNGIRKHYPEWFQKCKGYLSKEYGMRRPETLDVNEWMNLYCNFIKNKKNVLDY